MRSRNYSAGILVKAGDPNELTHAVARALFRPETTESLRQTAREVAHEYDVSNRWNRLWALYRDIAQ